MVKLDLKDKRILYELDLDSRQSFHKIAKKVGLSKDSVISRINNLKKLGIIERFHTVIDVGKLGFISFRLYLKFHNLTQKTENDIITFLKKQKIVTWLAGVEEKFDLGMWVLVKEIGEMNNFYSRLLEKYQKYINKRWLTILTNVEYYSRSYFLDKPNNKEFPFITMPKKTEISKRDLEVLKFLAENSRTSLLEIAQKVKLSPLTVSRRIKDLEKKKIIIGYRTMFDLEKLGYQYYKFHLDLQNRNKETIKEFKLFAKQNPNIIYDNEVLGGHDIEWDIQVKNLNRLRKIIKQLKEKFSKKIKNYETFLICKEHKYVFFPL